MTSNLGKSMHEDRWAQWYSGDQVEVMTRASYESGIRVGRAQTLATMGARIEEEWQRLRGGATDGQDTGQTHSTGSFGRMAGQLGGVAMVHGQRVESVRCEACGSWAWRLGSEDRGGATDGQTGHGQQQEGWTGWGDWIGARREEQDRQAAHTQTHSTGRGKQDRQRQKRNGMEWTEEEKELGSERE
jgi:hypothetical protein